MFSSLVVFWSPDALVLWLYTLRVAVPWSSGPLVPSFLGPVVMMSRNCKWVSMGFVVVVPVFVVF